MSQFQSTFFMYFTPFKVKIISSWVENQNVIKPCACLTAYIILYLGPNGLMPRVLI